MEPGGRGTEPGSRPNLGRGAGLAAVVAGIVRDAASGDT